MSHLHLAPAGVGVVGRGACLLTVALEAGERADEAVGAAQPLLALLLLLLLLLLNTTRMTSPGTAESRKRFFSMFFTCPNFFSKNFSFSLPENR